MNRLWRLQEASSRLNKKKTLSPSEIRDHVCKFGWFIELNQFIDLFIISLISAFHMVRSSLASELCRMLKMHLFTASAHRR